MIVSPGSGIPAVLAAGWREPTAACPTAPQVSLLLPLWFCEPPAVAEFAVRVWLARLTVSTLLSPWCDPVLGPTAVPGASRPPASCQAGPTGGFSSDKGQLFAGVVVLLGAPNPWNQCCDKHSNHLHSEPHTGVFQAQESPLLLSSTAQWQSGSWKLKPWTSHQEL